MEAKVTWKGRLSFDGSAETGFVVPLGAHPSVGGDNDGFRPMELIALGLAGCTGMDVVSILHKKRQEISGFETRIHAEQSGEHPKVFTRITIDYLIEGYQIDPVAVQRAIELSTTRYCPAQAMLSKAVEINTQYTIREPNRDS
jgi:putative redox protein